MPGKMTPKSNFPKSSQPLPKSKNGGNPGQPKYQAPLKPTSGSRDTGLSTPKVTQDKRGFVPKPQSGGSIKGNGPKPFGPAVNTKMKKK